MPTVNELLLAGSGAAPVSILHTDDDGNGSEIARAWWVNEQGDARTVFSTADAPHITRFVVAPDYGVQGATVQGLVGWDVTGTVTSTTLEHRLAASTGAWIPIGFPDGTTDSDTFTFPNEDFLVRLTVANALGEQDQRVQRVYRTLAPSIQDWSYANYHQSASGYVVTSWDFSLTCLSWPKPVVSVSGSTAGQLHVSQGLIQRTSVANGWSLTLRHSVGGVPDYDQAWVVTVHNPITNESASSTLRLGG